MYKIHFNMPFPAECPQEPSMSHRTCKAAHGYWQTWMLQFTSTPPRSPKTHTHTHTHTHTRVRVRGRENNNLNNVPLLVFGDVWSFSKSRLEISCSKSPRGAGSLEHRHFWDAHQKTHRLRISRSGEQEVDSWVIPLQFESSQCGEAYGAKSP